MSPKPSTSFGVKVADIFKLSQDRNAWQLLYKCMDYVEYQAPVVSLDYYLKLCGVEACFLRPHGTILSTASPMLRGTASVLLVMALISLGGCRSSRGPYKTALLGSKIASFDPIGVSEYNEMTLFSQICGRLTSVDSSLNIGGDLAKSWEISPDRKTFTFRLQDDRHFPDGSAVTVEDVTFSLKRASDRQASVTAAWLDEVKTISSPDPGTLKIELKKGNPRLLYKLSHPRFCVLNHKLPFSIIGGISVPNSSAPYYVAETREDGGILLKASGDFKGRVLEKDILVNFLSQTEAVAEFKKGNLHDLSFYLLEEKELADLPKDTKVLRTPIYWSWTVALNPSRPYFKTLGARTRFVRNFRSKEFLAQWHSDVSPSHSVIPKGMRGYTEEGFPYGLLDGTAIKPSPRTPLRVTVIQGMPFESNLSLALKSEIQRATGSNAEIVFLEMGTWSKDYAERASDIYVSGIDTNSTDPIGFYRYFIKGGSENFPGYDNLKLNEMFHRLEEKLAEERSVTDYVEIQKRFYEAAFAVVVGHPTFRFAYDPSVEHVHMNPLGMHLNRWGEIGRE